MPGLAGFVSLAGSVGDERSRGILDRMAEVLDPEREFRRDTCLARRFGLLRVQRGAEGAFPYQHHPRGPRLFFHGELYALGQVDVLGEDFLGTLSAQLSWEEDRTLASSDGSFLLAHFDPIANRLLIANDVTSSRPLYLAERGGVLYFAPELKALLAVEAASQAIDESALAFFLATGMMPLDATLFAGIRALKPATKLILDIGKSRWWESPYWRHEYREEPCDCGRRRYEEELNALIHRAVGRRIRDRGRRRIAVSLSGGFDSRSILGSCLEQGANVGTLTVGADLDRFFSDARIAKEIAARHGLRHSIYALSPAALQQHLEGMVYLCDGQIDRLGDYPEGLRQYRRIARDYDVILRGDELFGWRGAVYSEDEALASFGLVPLPEAYAAILEPAAYSRLSAASRVCLRKLGESCDQRHPVDRKDCFVFHQGVPNLWGRSNYLKSHAIDIRTPFLDREILEFVGKLPRKYRLHRRLFCGAMRRRYPELFETPCARHGNLPSWERAYLLHEDLRAHVERVLLDSNSPRLDALIDQEGLKRYLSFSRQRLTGPTPGARRGSRKRQRGIRPRLRGKAARLQTRMEEGILCHDRLYRMTKPLLARRKAEALPSRDSDLLMRLLVLKHWETLLREERRHLARSAP